MQTLHIQLKERTYPIYIGEGLLSQIQLIDAHLKQKHVAVVTNTTVAPLYLNVASFVVDTGQQKTQTIINKIESLLS